MNACQQDTSPAARDKKAETLARLGAPYMPLLTFLREAPLAEIRYWAKSATLYDAEFWNGQDSSQIACLSYAFNRLWPGLNTQDLELKRHWNIANPPEAARAIIERYAAFQQEIEYELVQPFTGAAKVMPEWAESKANDLRDHLAHLLSFGLQVVEKPEDLLPGHRVIGFGLTPQKYVSKTYEQYGSAYHFARLDRNGFWSEKFKNTNVITAQSTDPLSLTTWSAPTCFLQLRAQNTPS